MNDVLSLLEVWGDSDTDSDMASVVMTGMWSLSLIKFGVAVMIKNLTTMSVVIIRSRVELTKVMIGW